MSAAEKSERFAQTLMDGGGAVLACRVCGSARVDHQERETVYCLDCRTSGRIDPNFALLRCRWLTGDLMAALRTAER